MMAGVVHEVHVDAKFRPVTSQTRDMGVGSGGMGDAPQDFKM